MQADDLAEFARQCTLTPGMPSTRLSRLDGSGRPHAEAIRLHANRLRAHGEVAPPPSSTTTLVDVAL